MRTSSLTTQRCRWLIAALVLTTSPAWGSEPSAKTVDTADSTRVVKTLYREFAWEVIFEDADFVALVDLPDAQLARFFTPGLSRLFAEDRACRMTTHQTCRLDFSPIYATASQQATRGIAISPTSSRNEVQVVVTINGDTTTLRFKLVHSPVGWRIDDIVYENLKVTLRDVLSHPEHDVHP